MRITLTMPQTTLSDAELGSGANERAALTPMDEDAFRGFYERTSRQVWVYLSRITGDRQLADDLLQEAYYRFLRANAAHESETHRRNSLFRIATNLARDAQRRERRRPTDRIPAERWDELQAEEPPTISMGGRTDLTRAMEQLKPAQREILWLAYAIGASHVEIAETLGLTAGSVKQLLFRARKKLARLLGRP